MKIAVFGLENLAGKVKYAPACFDQLVEKFSPGKKTPFSVEFTGLDFEQCDAIVFDNNKKFDFVFIDLEKIETRLQRTADDSERKLLEKVQGLLEKEVLLYDEEFSETERQALILLQLVTFKPCLGVTQTGDMDSLIKEVLERSGVILFYTVGKKEVRIWSINRGATALEAAAKIHSDLARGFIKADIVNCRQLDNFFNMAEARAKGLVKTVDRDHLVEDGDIIDIKFNV